MLLLPLLLEGFGGPTAWLREGLFGWSWLAPDQLFGLGDWSRLGRAVTLSLLAGTTVTWLASAGGEERVEPSEGGGLARARLHEIAARFLPADKLQGLLADAGEADDAVSRVVELRIERELAAVLGAASARLLLDAARREQGRDLDAVANIVGEASQALRFNQRVLEAALENMSQGISVVDRGSCGWWPGTRATRSCSPIPSHCCGSACRSPSWWRTTCAADWPATATAAARCKSASRTCARGTPYVAERRFGDSVIEIRGNPMPGGGFVATFTDVTAFRRTEAELKGIAETLEQRVVARTAELEGAKGEAERANAAKTRFLAAVSHDLAQPLNAAHLFTHALAQQLEHAQYREAIGNIDGALGSAEGLLAGLLDISRLDAGGWRRTCTRFAWTKCCSRWRLNSACWRSTRACACTTCRRAPGCAATRSCCGVRCRTSSPTRCATPAAAASCWAAGAVAARWRSRCTTPARASPRRTRR
jgi:PAS domain-containing protein